MFLKYLEIQGFKSFPDRVKIEFVQGITGIVGPNGSGKSNISDAVRWVMGEQSIKSLRGGKMEDVIFAGTQDRKPLGFAEVSVCFDNTDHVFKLDYEEVLITRRLFRSGESEYYLNKAACRLKDIHEILMDTGMGRDGYSVVGQGKIDEMISAKPEDRRVILEEAAGISKFRYRKAEAERKMQQTQDNLLRLLDLMSEIEQRLEPLEKESEKARCFLKLRDELKEIEISLSLHQIDKIKEEIQRLTEEQKVSNDSLEQFKQDSVALEKKSEELRKTAKEQEGAQGECTQSIFECRNNILSLKNSISLLLNSREHNSETVLRLDKEIEKITRQMAEVKEELLNNEEEIKTFEEGLGKSKTELDEARERYARFQENADNVSRELEKANEDILELIRLVANSKAQLSGADTAMDGIKAREIANNEDLEILLEDMEANKRRLSAEEEKQKTAEGKLEEKRKQTNDASDRLTKTAEALASAQENLRSGRTLAEQLADKKEMLLEMERAMEGYSHSVKTVLSEAKGGSLSNIKAYGTVASVISVAPEYTVSVEAALGGNMQNIITETEGDAKAAISYLKDKKAGRATFLPVSAVKGRRLDAGAFKGEKGALGLASDLVKTDGKFKGVIDELLGRTIVMDNMDNAIAFSKKYKQQHRLVTLDGEIFAPGGAISGGNLGKGTGFLSRKAEISKLEERIKKAQEGIEKTEAEVKDLLAKEEELKAEVKSLGTEVQMLENELYKLSYNANHYREIGEGLIKEQEAIFAEIEETKRAKAQILENKESSAVLIEEKERELADLRNKADRLQEEGSGHSGEIRNLNNEILRITVDVSNFENDFRSACEKKEASLALIGELEGELQEKSAERQNAGSEDGEINQKVSALEEQIKAQEDAASALEIRLAEIKGHREGTDKRQIENASDIKKCSENILLCSEELARLENKISRKEGDLDHIQTKLWEDYELTYLSAQPLRKEIENYGECSRRVNTLRREIKDLGPVNVGAIDEYKDTKERYDFMTEQKNDLDSAKQTLGNVITDMESLMEKQFKEQLGIINDAFGRVFRDLFSGGAAELVLTDESNVLSSGVEIHAQPPGKKLQNMTLFSGGEKAIIAIALLFALLEVRPSPLCVLDEIEAALDDVNVARFAQYLRKISKRSQIAIITHRRGTMEEADTLYGITMQEKGISKILSLNIDEMEEKILKQK